MQRNESPAAWRYELAWGQDGSGRTLVISEVYGPNVSPIRTYRTRRGARFAAWWRNKARGLA
jgi:hypothetical protein